MRFYIILSIILLTSGAIYISKDFTKPGAELTKAPFFGAVDITLNSFSQTEITSGTGSITVPSLTNGLVACLVVNVGGATNVTSATFGGVSATAATSQYSSDGSNSVIFWAVGVPSGSQTFSWNGTDTVYFECWFLENVAQVSPVDTANTAAGAVVAITTSVSTFIVGTNRNFSVSVTSSDTITHASGASLRWVDSNGMVAAGTITNTWNAGGGTALVAFKAGGAGGATFAPWQFNDF